MSTHSTIGYELPCGGYAGCMCQFDGYPDHMFPVLGSMTHEQVMIVVERGLLGAGIRGIESFEDYETYGDFRGESSTRDEMVVTEWPNCRNEYNYRKRLDGGVDCVDSLGNVRNGPGDWSK